MALRHSILWAATVTLLVTLVPGCRSRPEAVAPRAAQQKAQAIGRSAPSLQEIKNANYRGVEEAGDSFTLTNGRWEGKPYAPGGASRPTVTFVRDFRLTGDLDGDGSDEAIVLLAANAGGSGEMTYLAAIGRPGGTLRNIATARVGDRVQVRDARVEARRIVLDVVQAGDGDAACCPGELVRRSWALVEGMLKEGAPVKTGRLTIDTLAGSEWVLRAWSWDEPAPLAPPVTLKLDGSRLVGNAGCNNYFAAVTSGGAPGDIEVGAAGSTRKMCPEAEMTVEQRFLQQLGGATGLQFVGGQLALSYAKPDKSAGVMLFDRRPAR